MALEVGNKVRRLNTGNPRVIKHGIVTSVDGDTCTVSPVHTDRKSINIPVDTVDGHLPLMDGAVEVTPKWAFVNGTPIPNIDIETGVGPSSIWPWVPCNYEVSTIATPYKRTAFK